MSALQRRLKSLPKQECQKMLDYYAEMIEDRMEEWAREVPYKIWGMWK